MRLPAIVLLSVLLVAILVAVPPTTAADDAPSPERLIFMVEYVGTDYTAAVRDGRVINDFEYQEMIDLSTQLVEHAGVLQQHGASVIVTRDLIRLQELILDAAPPGEVRTLCRRLVSTLLEQLDEVVFPAVSPSVERGGVLFAQGCAPCHGVAGAGDGFAAAWQEPPPTSFRESRMNLFSPHQIYSSVKFGIDGTPMPSFDGSLRDGEMWDVAFFTMTLRDGFDPASFVGSLPVSLRDLSARSNEALLARLAEEGLSASPAGIDFYRLQPARAMTTGAAAAPDVDDTALAAAFALQEAFARVAETVFPSVVGINALVRVDQAPVESEQPAGWREDSLEARLYPGFRRVRSASGFFLTEDGYILTCAHVVTDSDGRQADVIDVELHDNERVVGRVVGIEPTLDLAVLKLEVVSKDRRPDRPVGIGDSDAVRVGHWAIALGDPWGAEQTYAVGTLSSPANRRCYQEQLSATLLQASLNVHPEAYGGPLVNIRGEVIGMTVPRGLALGVETPGVAPASEFALPINLAIGIYESLRLAESTRSPWLGVSVLELPAVRRRQVSPSDPVLPPTGVYIDNVFDPSPASLGGVRVGDSLTAIDGNRILSALGFQRWLYLSGIGRTVVVEIFRDGETFEQRLTIEERPGSAITR